MGPDEHKKSPVGVSEGNSSLCCLLGQETLKGAVVRSISKVRAIERNPKEAKPAAHLGLLLQDPTRT